MRVIILAGRPRCPSRSIALLNQCQPVLAARRVEVVSRNIHNFQPEDLIGARFDAPALTAFKADLVLADDLAECASERPAALSGGQKQQGHWRVH